MTRVGSRLPHPGIEVTAADAAFTFAGARVDGYEGETVAAALTAAGVAAFGSRGDGSARGMFCGMGVCQECLVEVDGAPSLRACMTPIRSGIRVEPQPSAFVPVAPREALGEGVPATMHRPEVLVVGAGPAGLSAAWAAALCGAEVVLIDERPALGGQYFKQLGKPYAITDAAAVDAQLRAGQELIAEVEALGVRIWREAMVWGAFGGDELAVSAGGAQHVFAPGALILATGAYERGVPVPGWTLPGFMTTGAAQTLQRAYRVAPGRRVLIAGNGPLNLQVAADLVAAGIGVVAVVEAAPRPGLGRIGAMLRMARNSPDLVRDGLSYLARLRRAGMPVHYGSAVIAATGVDRVERAAIARIDDRGAPVPGTEQEFAVDAVCAGYGFLPSNEIARGLGCRHHHDAASGSLVPDCDDEGLTSKAGVFVVGDGGAMGGARAAVEQGHLAGCAAARAIGKAPPPEIERELPRRRARLGRHRAFQAALWQLFAAPPLTTQLVSEDTVLCRCEGVTLGQIRGAIGDSVSSLAAVKRRTRAGMGRCQGRYCASLIAGLTAAESGIATHELSFAAPRPPIKPVPIASIARRPLQ